MIDSIAAYLIPASALMLGTLAYALAKLSRYQLQEHLKSKVLTAVVEDRDPAPTPPATVDFGPLEAALKKAVQQIVASTEKRRVAERADVS